MHQPTKRQKTLITRLVRLGEMVSNNLLPLNVTEILGFGSFFRGKTSPKDVDLMVRHSGSHDPQFQEFMKLVAMIRKDVALQRRYREPQLALGEAFDKSKAGMLPGLLDHSEKRAIFLSWLDGYSWRMLFPATVNEQVEIDFPWRYTRRLLQRSVPSLNVVLALGPEADPLNVGLRTGFAVSIWSPRQRDMEANLREVLVPHNFAMFQRQDYDHFQKQEYVLRGTLLVLSELALLLRARNRKMPLGWMREWLREQAPSFGGVSLDFLLSHGWLLTEEEIEKATGHKYAANPPPENLPESVEELRKRINDLWIEVEAWRSVVNALESFWNDGNKRTDFDKFIRSALPAPKNREFRIYQDVLAKIGIALVRCV
jgi:hypothetical protein